MQCSMQYADAVYTYQYVGVCSVVYTVFTLHSMQYTMLRHTSAVGKAVHRSNLSTLQFSQVEQSIVRRQDVGLMGVKLMAEVSAGG